MAKLIVIWTLHYIGQCGPIKFLQTLHICVCRLNHICIVLEFSYWLYGPVLRRICITHSPANVILLKSRGKLTLQWIVAL